jgi:hypothetical protein
LGPAQRPGAAAGSEALNKIGKAAGRRWKTTPKVFPTAPWAFCMSKLCKRFGAEHEIELTRSKQIFHAALTLRRKNFRAAICHLVAWLPRISSSRDATTTHVPARRDAIV